MLAEGSVARWWGAPDPPEVIAADLDGGTDTHLLVIEVDGSVAGGIQYGEETTPRYRHATVDVYLGAAHQGHGFGSEAVRPLVDFLIHERGHHRITIDPAVANTRAVRCYESVGFRPVGMLRQYEHDPTGTAHDGLLMERLADDDGPRLRAAVPTAVPAAGCGAPQCPADGHRLGDGRVRGVRPGRQPADRVRTTAVIGDYAGWRAAAHYPQRSKPCNGSSVIIGLPCQTPGVPAPRRRGGAAGGGAALKVNSSGRCVII